MTARSLTLALVLAAGCSDAAVNVGPGINFDECESLDSAGSVTGQRSFTHEANTMTFVPTVAEIQGPAVIVESVRASGPTDRSGYYKASPRRPSSP